MDRIIITGKTGSGKTTFADTLGKNLNREVIHLDNLFWKEGWERVFTREEWLEKIQELAAQDRWILDGNYSSVLPLILERADTVVFFDLAPLQTLIRALRRKYFPSAVTADVVPNLHQQAGLWQILKATFKYPRKEVLKQISASKCEHIFILKNRRQAKTAFEEITKFQ